MVTVTGCVLLQFCLILSSSDKNNDFLIVGRTILDSKNPVDTAKKIQLS